MIQIIPSISIIDGKVAKLSHGDYQQAKLYDKSPLDLAMYFQDNGFKCIHLVDLDGAREESVINYQTLSVIAGHTSLEINFSGGIRTDGGVQLALENGASKVTVASIAATNPDLFMSWLISFGRKKLVLGADVEEGKIVTRGWQTHTDIDAFAHMQHFYERGVQNLKLTDVGRDGLLQGPNFELIEQALKQFPNYDIMVSGGVRNIADVEQLDALGVKSVIIARALYEDKITMAELVRFV